MTNADESWQPERQPEQPGPAPEVLLARINPDEHAAAVLAGRWMTGEGGLTGITVTPIRSGADIATELRAAIDRTKKFPSQPGKEPPFPTHD